MLQMIENKFENLQLDDIIITEKFIIKFEYLVSIMSNFRLIIELDI